MLRYFADFATLLHAVVHCIPFQWIEVENTAYKALKIMLSQARIMQPLNWTKDFHVFLDVSGVASGSTLMQLSELKWYRQVYYTRWKLSLAESHYSTMEREALGMVYSFNKFRHYLLG